MLKLTNKNNLYTINNFYMSYHIYFLYDLFLKNKEEFYNYLADYFQSISGNDNYKEIFSFTYTLNFWESFSNLNPSELQNILSFLDFLIRLGYISNYIVLSDDFNLISYTYVIILIDTLINIGKKHFLSTDIVYFNTIKPFNLFKEINLEKSKNNIQDIKKFDLNTFCLLEYIEKELYICVKTNLKNIQIKISHI